MLGNNSTAKRILIIANNGDNGTNMKIELNV